MVCLVCPWTHGKYFVGYCFKNVRQPTGTFITMVLYWHKQIQSETKEGLLQYSQYIGLGIMVQLGIRYNRQIIWLNLAGGKHGTGANVCLLKQVVPGETALAFYKAKNPTDKPVIGISTYNVVPFEAGQYFNKIQVNWI